MAIKPPAMTPPEVAEAEADHPTVRVNCYRHGCELFAGHELPEGGADAVARAAGCPSWGSTDPAVFDDCPVPDELAGWGMPAPTGGAEPLPLAGPTHTPGS